MYVCIYIYVCSYICVCMYIKIHTYIHSIMRPFQYNILIGCFTDRMCFNSKYIEIILVNLLNLQKISAM